MSMIIRNHVRYASGGNGGDPSIEITQAEYDELVITNSIQKDVTYYITDSKDEIELDATAIKYDNTESGLEATDVQSAISELNSNLDYDYSGTYVVGGVWGYGYYGNNILYVPNPIPVNKINDYNIEITEVIVGYLDKANAAITNWWKGSDVASCQIELRSQGITCGNIGIVGLKVTKK